MCREIRRDADTTASISLWALKTRRAGRSRIAGRNRTVIAGRPESVAAGERAVCHNAEC